MIVMLIFLMGAVTPDVSRILPFSSAFDCRSAAQLVPDNPAWWKIECKDMDGEVVYSLLKG